MAQVKKITVFCGPEASANQAALAAVQRLHDVQVETVGDTARLRPYLSLPFIQTSDDDRYYGLDSIQRFVDRVLTGGSPPWPHA